MHEEPQKSRSKESKKKKKKEKKKKERKKKEQKKKEKRKTNYCLNNQFECNKIKMTLITLYPNVNETTSNTRLLYLKASIYFLFVLTNSN